MSIVIEHLDCAYGRLAALRDISVRAREGAITAVVGPNAAGKSTLLRAMIGAIRPAGGRVLIDNQIAHETPARGLARRIAYVPQRSIVSAAFTVRQVVEIGRYALPASAARVEDAINRLDLADIADRPYPNLSVGQQQRVTLARAIAQLEPGGHLILDEPTSGMDLRHITIAAQVLRDVALMGGGSRQATVVLALHDLALVASIADEVWLLSEGRLTAHGAAKEVLQVDRLQSVFGVDFEWVTDRRGQSRLMAGIQPAPPDTEPRRLDRV